MNKKEQEAIEKINNSYDWNTGWVECEAKTWNIIKNLIDKLQKENEELKKQVEQWKKTCLDFTYERERILKAPYIPKDKIRNIIDNSYPDIAISKILELLEEK